MGRHTPRARSRRSPWLVLVVATALAVAAAAWVITRPVDPTAAAADSACTTSTEVAVAVAPELAELVDGLLAEPVPFGDDGACAEAVVRWQEPLQTAGDLQVLDLADQPQVWVPDDAGWVVRAGDSVEQVGSLARTSVVLATTRAQAEDQGWTTQPPTWAEALAAGLQSTEGVLLGQPATDPAALAVLATVPATLGAGEQAAELVTAAALATQRGSVQRADALAAVVAGEAAPLVVATEYEVGEAVADGTGELVVVRPVEGTPSLVVPVVSTGAAEGSAAAAAVLDSLVAAGESGSAVRAAGWRDLDGGAPDVVADDATGVGGVESDRLVLEPALVQGLLSQLAALATPSRLLAAVDVSLSMDAVVGDTTRAGLAVAAMTSAMAVLPDRTIGAFWVFAHQLAGDQDWVELVPARSLDTQVGGQNQRELILGQIAAVPGMLSAGGTGLYDTTLAAVRSARDGYDPGAVNSVVLLTDGSDEDSAGIGEQELLDTLVAEADPERPVQVIAVGMGPDADQDALQRIAEATGGAAYAALDPTDLQSVLFQALGAR